MKLIRDWLRTLDELIFPSNPLCALCVEHPSLAVGTCQVCLDSLALGWQKEEIHGYSYYSLFPYQGFGRDLIHKMKFLSGYEIACTFGSLLGMALREELELSSIELIIPVPLHPRRYEQRGFNQASILADKISRAWKRPVSQHVVRVRETQQQSGLSSAKRKHNLVGAFAVLPGCDFKDKCCLIVDDVITSGYTFCSMARLIEQYGGKPVGVFVARTEIYKE